MLIDFKPTDNIKIFEDDLFVGVYANGQLAFETRSPTQEIRDTLTTEVPNPPQDPLKTVFAANSSAEIIGVTKLLTQGQITLTGQQYLKEEYPSLRFEEARFDPVFLKRLPKSVQEHVAKSQADLAA